MTSPLVSLTGPPAAVAADERPPVGGAMSGVSTATGPLPLMIIVFALVVGFVATAVTKRIVGADFDGLMQRAQIKEARIAKEGFFTLGDGTKILYHCWKSNTAPANVGGGSLSNWFSCSIYAGATYLLKYEMWDAINNGRFQSSIRFFRAPKLIDARTEINNKLTLAPFEFDQGGCYIDGKSNNRNCYTVGELVPTIPLLFNINFDIEEDSLKALFVSALQTSVHLEGLHIDEFGVNRIASQLAEQVKSTTGLFEVRADKRVLLLGGTFQSIVLFVFYSCAALTIVVLFVAGLGWPQALIASVERLGALASSIGGSLTYFGLLGTLLGIFLAVGDLSAIDFVDEMKKVFDQTRSFGSMSLALGSSVLGLGGALIFMGVSGRGEFFTRTKSV
jgi:hypothetical protein